MDYKLTNGQSYNYTNIEVPDSTYIVVCALAMTYESGNYIGWHWIDHGVQTKWGNSQSSVTVSGNTITVKNNNSGAKMWMMIAKVL